MPKITKLSEQKKRLGRVNVYIDDVFAFGISEKLLVDYDLYKGKELTKEDEAKIKEAESLSKCLDKAYNFLSYRPRSEKEMRDKLLEKFEEETVDMAIIKLKDYNFINDMDFARMWVSSRGGSRSARALSFELKKKGVSKEVIEEAVSDIDKEKEFENALDIVRSKSKYHGLEKNEAYQKVGGFLARRGYNYDIIKRVITEIYDN
jgi:regulatory protein